MCNILCNTITLIPGHTNTSKKRYIQQNQTSFKELAGRSTKGSSKYSKLCTRKSQRS